MNGSRNRIADLLTLLVLGGLLAAVYVLPPDTSLAEVREAGILRVCIPPSYPPLITGDADEPGLDVELINAIGERLDLRVVYNVNSAIGSDFNPRNWRVTRAQCQIIAGGIVATELTRSFLDTTPPYLDTGWVLLSNEATQSLEDREVGVFVGPSGRDRIALGRFLREAGAVVNLVQSRNELVAGMESGAFDVAVTDAFIGMDIARTDNYAIAWLTADERDPVAIGLWKGDLTLKRAIVAEMNDLIAEGMLDDLMQRYGIIDIDSVYGAE